MEDGGFGKNNELKDHDLQAELEKLQNEYNLVNSKKNVFINRSDILRELETDPLITEKLHMKKKKSDNGCCDLF